MSDNKKHGTVIAQHSCAHVYQDQVYGRGMRVHNLADDGKARRCTVCGIAR